MICNLIIQFQTSSQAQKVPPTFSNLSGTRPLTQQADMKPPPLRIHAGTKSFLRRSVMVLSGPRTLRRGEEHAGLGNFTQIYCLSQSPRSFKQPDSTPNKNRQTDDGEQMWRNAVTP